MSRKKEEIVIEESDRVVHSKEKALRYSILEGSAAVAGSNLSFSFVTPYALAIGANSFHIGLLSSASNLFYPLGTLGGSHLMEKKSRKKILMNTKILTNIGYLFVASLAYFYWKGLFLDYLPYVLLVVWGVIIRYIVGRGHVAWFSWMGDIVNPKERGRYFARRNRVTGFVGLISFLLGAFILDFFKTKGFVLLGFMILFFLSGVLRVISKYFVGRMYNPQFRVKKGYYFSFKDFVKRYDNFGKFAFFQAATLFSVTLASPFFAVYMLDYLNFSYLTFTAVTMSSAVFYLIFAPLAGKFSDMYGNVKLLYVAGVLFPFVPVLWTFLEHPLALILLPGFVNGLANASYLLAVTNFTYDAVPPQKRGLCTSYTSILVGIGALFGGLLGGFLIEYVSFSFISPIFFVFLLSSLFIVMTALFFLPQLKDERRIKGIKGLRADVAHPFKTINSDVVWFKNFIHQK